MWRRSTDCGNTWRSTESSGITPMQFSVNSAVALDENTFYSGGITGIHRSRDGGETWHRFNTRFEWPGGQLNQFRRDASKFRSSQGFVRDGCGECRQIHRRRGMLRESWTAVDILRPRYTLEIPKFNAKLKDRGRPRR